MRRDTNWKPSAGFVIFVWMLVALALIWVFGFFTMQQTEEMTTYFWHETTIGFIKASGEYFYNIAPVAIGFIACFLPLLVFPIGKMMKNSQALLLFVLFFETLMAFVALYFFEMKIESPHILVEWMGNTLFVIEGTQILYVQFVIFSRFVGSIALCLLPFLAFPIANSVCRRKGYHPTLTTLLFLVSLIALAILTLGWYTGNDELYWYGMRMITKESIDQVGMFTIIVGYFVAVIPLLFLGKNKEKKEERREREPGQIFYVPIERR